MCDVHHTLDKSILLTLHALLPRGRPNAPVPLGSPTARAFGAFRPQKTRALKRLAAEGQKQDIQVLTGIKRTDFVCAFLVDRSDFRCEKYSLQIGEKKPPAVSWGSRVKTAS